MVFPGINQWSLVLGCLACACAPRASAPADQRAGNAAHEHAASPSPKGSTESEAASPEPGVDGQPSPTPNSSEPSAPGDESSAQTAAEPPAPAEPGPEASEPAPSAPPPPETPPSLDCASHDEIDAPEAERKLSRWICERQEEFQSFVFERQTCRQPSDCTWFWAQCPFGCGVSINTKHTAEVKAKHDDLVRQINARGINCRYRCRQFGEPTCVEGRCQ